MDFTKVKEWFSKVGIWLKKWWAILLLAISGLVILIFAKNRQKALEDLLEQAQKTGETHRKDLERVTTEFQAERAKREAIERTYQETLQRIEADRNIAISDLDKKKKTELKRIVEEVGDNPEEMANRINRLFGIKVER